jgi:hypothetical protein
MIYSCHLLIRGIRIESFLVLSIGHNLSQNYLHIPAHKRVCLGHGAVVMDGLARLIKLAEGLTLAPAYQRL